MPATRERDETFTVLDGHLVRTVAPARGKPYDSGRVRGADHLAEPRTLIHRRDADAPLRGRDARTPRVASGFGEQLAGELHGRLIGQCDFSLGCSAIRRDVPAMSHDQAVIGDLPQPEAQRQGRAIEIVRQATQSLDLCFLDNVGGIHAWADLVAQPEFNHLPQIGAVPGEEAVERFGVAVTKLL